MGFGRAMMKYVEDPYVRKGGSGNRRKGGHDDVATMLMVSMISPNHH